MIRKSCILFLIIILSGCNAVLNHNMRHKATGEEYKQANSDEPRAKVVMIGSEDFNAYYFLSYSYNPQEPKESEAHEFPSKKTDFNIPIPEDFQGKKLYSFYMKADEHQLSFQGYIQSAFSTKQCVIDTQFTPQNNKNYLFYFYKENDDLCRIKVKEAINENGSYKYIDVTTSLKKGVRDKFGNKLSHYNVF